MKKKNQIFALLVFLAIGLSSCDKSSDDDKDEEMEEMNDPCETTVQFSTTILPLIEANCTPCHTGEGAERGQLNTFATANANAAQIASRTKSGDMPRGGGSLTDKQIQDIACWVEQGALDN